jgi:hypothetical protein
MGRLHGGLPANNRLTAQDILSFSATKQIAAIKSFTIQAQEIKIKA